MSNKTLTQSAVSQSRRSFLKGAAYTSALSISAVSALANTVFASNGVMKPSTDNLNSTHYNGINIMQQQMLHKEAVTLFNTSDDEIMLDALHPINIERVNGSLQVKPNFIESSLSTGMIMILPRERVAFDIQTTGGHFSSYEIQDISKLSGQRLHITSEHFAFNKLIPVSNSESVMT